MNIIMRTETFAKLFFMVSFTGLVMYAVLAFYTFHTAFTTMYDYERHQTSNLPKQYSPPRSTDEPYTIFKYILIWTTPTNRVNVLGEGQGPFVNNNCTYVNCYLSTNKELLKKYNKEFDAIFIDIKVLRLSLWKTIMPGKRSSKQKYVFHSMRSADETPLCNVKMDGYFNWTWSYKIFSDIFTPFIEVKDKEGRKVAPRKDVKWIEHMESLSEKDIKKLNLKTKKKAVVWIPYNCQDRSKSIDYVVKLQDVLKDHGLELDIYGCGKKTCPVEGCLKVLKDYYFYLAFERSNAEDYVTDDVVTAYQHNVVPIVRGGADYRRFLPDGSYVNAGLGTVEKLASLIDFSIRNPAVYHSFHQWRNYYTIDRADHNQGLCQLCAMLNNEGLVQSENNYEQFRKWWNADANMQGRCLPKGAEDAGHVLAYVNESSKDIFRKNPLKI